MARERYTITDGDLGFATSYLSRKLQIGYWLSDDVSLETKAGRAYEKIHRGHFDTERGGRAFQAVAKR